MSRGPLAPLLALALAALAPAAAADEPIPFDAKKAAAMADRDRAWLDAASRAAYRAAGRRDPKWDADVDKALRANLDRVHGPIWDRPAAEARLRAALQFAADGGCDDPLVRYLRAGLGAAPADGADEGGAAAELLAAARALGASEYPALWKAQAHMAALAALAADPRAAADDRDACLGAALKAAAQLAKDSAPAARRQLVLVCDQVHQAGARLGKRKEWFDRVDKDVLARLPERDPARDECAGRFQARYAWDARGGAVAARVPPGQWKAFHDRLAEAERRLTAAWDLDPGCAGAAVEMITVCMGRGGDRADMEAWFRRAAAADPTRTDAWDRKLTYLQPKWHGSADDLRAFARETAGLGRWDTSLPLVALQAVRDAAPAGRADRDAYFRSPDVWADVGPVLDEVRKRYPTSPLGASAYLYFAWQCERNPAEALGYVRAVKLPLRVGLFPNALLVTSALDWAATKAGAKD